MKCEIYQSNSLIFVQYRFNLFTILVILNLTLEHLVSLKTYKQPCYKTAFCIDYELNIVLLHYYEGLQRQRLSLHFETRDMFSTLSPFVRDNKYNSCVVLNLTAFACTKTMVALASIGFGCPFAVPHLATEPVLHMEADQYFGCEPSRKLPEPAPHTNHRRF